MTGKKAEYRSAVRSRELIQKAYLELVQEKNDTDKITVTDIVKHAGINRSTFYAHYPDVRGVRGAFEEDTIQKMMHILNQFQFRNFFSDPLPVLSQINTYLREDPERYRILISQKGSAEFLDKLSRIFTEYMKTSSDVPDQMKHSAVFELRINFFAGGIIRLYRRWFLGELSCTPEEIAGEIARIIRQSSAAILDASGQ